MVDKRALFILIEEIAECQEKKVLRYAERSFPHLTREDIRQPNDFPALEEDPHFRYEEGVLEGVRTVQTALYTYFKSLGERA
jgi:hypothetical protein